MRLHLSLVAIAAFLGVVACSSDSSSADAGRADLLAVDAPLADLGPDGPVSGPLSIRVVLLDGVLAGYPRGWEVADTSAGTPGAGATVAVDLPGGQRVEKTADANGEVELEGVEWSKGTATVTAHVTGYQLVTHFGIRQADGPQTLHLVRPAPPQTVKVTVGVKNMDPDAKYLGAAASTHSWSCEGAAGAKVLDVEQGKPFTVLGLQATWPPLMLTRELLMQHVAWAKVEQPALTQAASAELDFASKLTPTRVKGTIELQSKGLVQTASRPRYWIRQRGSGLVLGIATRTTLTSGSQFAFEGEHVQVGSTAGVYTTYYAEVGNNWLGSYVSFDGYPKEGATVKVSFLPLPELVAPTDKTTPMKWSSPVRWKAEPDATPVLQVTSVVTGGSCLALDAADALALPWLLIGTRGSSELALPRLPSSVTAQAMPELFAKPQCYVSFAADLDAKTLVWARWSNGPTFYLEAP